METIPDEILTKILLKCHTKHTFKLVCKRWNFIISSISNISYNYTKTNHVNLFPTVFFSDFESKIKDFDLNLDDLDDMGIYVRVNTENPLDDLDTSNPFYDIFYSMRYDCDSDNVYFHKNYVLCIMSTRAAIKFTNLIVIDLASRDVENIPLKPTATYDILENCNGIIKFIDCDSDFQLKIKLK